MAQSLIQPKKQGNRNSSYLQPPLESIKWLGGQTLKKKCFFWGGVGNIGGSLSIRGLGSFCQLCIGYVYKIHYFTTTQPLPSQIWSIQLVIDTPYFKEVFVQLVCYHNEFKVFLKSVKKLDTGYDQGKFCGQSRNRLRVLKDSACLL